MIIGSTDPTLSDLISSPFRPAFPGIEVHGTALENLLLQQHLIDYGSVETLFTFFSLLMAGLGLSFLVSYWEVGGALVGMLTTFLALPLFSFYGIASGGYLFHFTYPWLALSLLTAIVTLVNVFIEQ